MAKPSSDDPILWLEGEDPDMRAAIKAAQESLGVFLAELHREAHRVVPALDVAIVKAFFPDPRKPTQGEHMWVDDVAFVEGVFTGTLTGEPTVVRSLREGQSVRFPPHRLSDWIYVIDGRGKGGFTLAVVKKQLSPKEWRQYSKEPPFIWFA